MRKQDRLDDYLLEADSDWRSGWYHLAGLQYVAEKGRWPSGLTKIEKRRLREIGYVKIAPLPHQRVGRQPTLTEMGKWLIDYAKEKLEATVER